MLMLPTPVMVRPPTPLDPVDEAMWYPVVPVLISALDDLAPAGMNVGVLFTVQAIGPIHSLCYYRIDEDMSPSGTLSLWQVSNYTDVLLEQIDFTGHSGTGWRVEPLATPVDANPARAYMAALWLPPIADRVVFPSTVSFFPNHGRYSVPNSFLYGVVSNGQADPRGFIRRNGFVTAGPFQRPTGNFNHNNYWVDAIINAVPKPPYPDPPLNLKWPVPDGWPTFTNTGHDPETELTVHLDGFSSSADSELIEDLDVHGTLSIIHNNVTVRNCKIRGAVDYVINIQRGTAGTLIEDCTVDGVGRQNPNCGGMSPGNFSPASAPIGVAGSVATIRRCDIFRVENGLAFQGGGVLLEDSFIHNLRAGPGHPHYDGMQMDGSNSNVIIRHNTVMNENGDTSAIMIDNYDGATDDVLVTDNVLGGGGYSCYVTDFFHPHPEAPITNVRYIRNKMYLPKYNYFTIDSDTVPPAVFQGNQFLDHGGIYDSPPPFGFTAGDLIPEDFLGIPPNIPASIVGDPIDVATGGLTLGMSFYTSKDAQITHFKFFRPAATSTLVVKVGIWRYLGANKDAGVELLGEQTYTNILRIGWAGFELTTPIDVEAGDNLLIGVFIPRGHDGKSWYAAKGGDFFPSGKISQWDNMTAFANSGAVVNGFASCNGMYHYGPDLAPPLNASAFDNNFYVDPIFVCPWPEGVAQAEGVLLVAQGGTYPVVRAPACLMLIAAGTVVWP